MSQYEISYRHGVYTIERYTSQCPPLTVLSGMPRVKMIDCTVLPKLPGSVTRLSLVRCDLNCDLGQLAGVTSIQLNQSTLVLEGTRCPDAQPLHLEARQSAIHEGASPSGTLRVCYDLDYQSALLSSGLARGQTSLSCRLTITPTEAQQLSELAEAGVWRIPPTRLFYLPEGWTGPILGDPMVEVGYQTTVLPPGARRVVMCRSRIYLEDTGDLAELYLPPCYVDEYSRLYPGVPKFKLDCPSCETDLYRGSRYHQPGAPVEDRPLPAAEQARLRRRVELLCPASE